MDFKKITVIGIGLIGSSFALALKKQGFNGTITGVGRNEDNLINAKELGMIDAYSTDHAEGVKDADLIMLASPVGQFEPIINEIKNSIKPGAIVTDVGSVKAEVIKKLEPLMPDNVSFVAGHPIAGKESSGIEEAAADLFQNANYIYTPTPATDRDALAKVIDLWSSIGAITVQMTPDEHDLIFAAVSHMPHVIAYSIVNSILEIDNNMLAYSGGGLKDMTRIAMSPPELWRDICSFNKGNILMALKTFSSSISHMIDLFEKSDWSAIEREFRKAKDAKQLIESD